MQINEHRDTDKKELNSNLNLWQIGRKIDFNILGIMCLLFHINFISCQAMNKRFSFLGWISFCFQLIVDKKFVIEWKQSSI